MGDRRRTSLKLTEDAFDHLEEEQERRNLSTQQDTVEAIIQDNKKLRASDGDAESEDDAAGDDDRVENPLAAGVWRQARAVFTLTLVSTAVLVALYVAPLVPGVGVTSLPVAAGLVGAVTVVLALSSATLAVVSALVARVFTDPEVTPNPRAAALATDGGQPADGEGGD